MWLVSMATCKLQIPKSAAREKINLKKKKKKTLTLVLGRVTLGIFEIFLACFQNHLCHKGDSKFVFYPADWQLGQAVYT